MTRLLAALIPILAVTQLVSAQEPIRERIEWADIWVTDADKDDLPRVLLIGDSITRGYFGEVEKLLAGKWREMSDEEVDRTVRQLVKFE